MKTLVALTLACGALAAHARPLVIQESARLANPNAAAHPDFGSLIALDGDEALISLSRYEPHYPDADDENFTSVWLFRRTNGAWAPVRELATDHDIYYLWPDGLSMRNGIAALALNPIQVFEKVNGDWVQSQVAPYQDMPGSSIAVDGTRIFYGGTSGPFMGTLFEKNTAGVWSQSATMVGEYRGGDDEFFGREVDLSGSYAAVISPYTEESQGLQTPNVAIFFDFGPNAGADRWGRNWTVESTTENPFGTALQLRGTELFVSGDDHTGTHVFQRQPTSAWTVVDHLQPVDGYMGGGTTSSMRKSDAYLMQNSFSFDRNARVINVFAKNSGTYQLVATLASSDGASLGGFAISGRTVMASCGGEACFFELPATISTPAPIQDAFAGTSPTGWTVSAGSQFSIVQSGASRVLRQADTASTATHTALLTASNWTNQSVQADVKPTAIAGTDRWVGLAARYRDASNYYYVTLRSSGNVVLRRNVNGVFRTIASAPLPFGLNRTYRLRLEAIGTRLRVYADGVPLLDADDTALSSGRAALLTYRSAAEFDNVVVTPTPTATLWAGGQPERDFSYDWTTSGPGLWTNQGVSYNGERAYGQYSVAGDARAAIGVPTDDQTVDVVARATTFAGTGTGDRWFGVMARYTDAANFYYLSMRSGGTVSLRRVANNSITVLGTVQMPVTQGTWYRLRLDTIGTRLRAYVNDTLVLEATDSTHVRGKPGLVTYRTAAEFARFKATQP